MKKIIIPTGYMLTGSSAVTDLISEFEDVNNDYGSFEYVFLHCPNGVFDLEDKLLIGNNALRSDEAIHSFIKTMKQLYDKKLWWVGNYKEKMCEEFYNYSLEYIESLIDIKLDNFWYYQENTNFSMLVKLIIRKIIYYISLKKVLLKKPTLHKQMMLSYVSREKFYKESKKYIEKLLSKFDRNNQDLLLDQLLLPHNLHRINNYFDDNVRVIVVDRDPRDVFILNKYIYTQNDDGVAYSHDVKDFCKQYKKIKESETITNDNKILKIYFEDLIYKYEDTKKLIIKFLGYQNKRHINPKKHLDPAKSIKNTQVYKKEEYKEEIEYIEKNLSTYLYTYPDSEE